ncbi:MAG TPA: right-handed parallel beta-helix repeat-containing protein, partial [Gemmataceae bacterium]|nr:right-handed parallel beta-helix repeat-containing protein [Gemmataceae bacterium]
MYVKRIGLAWLWIVLGTALAHPALAADYYVSTAGDDSRDGTTPDRAWRSVARAGRQELRPGDRLLFRGGDTFEGSLVVKTAGTPSAASPITIGSYGPGKAVLRSGNGTAVLVENSGGIVIRYLIVEGKDRRTNQGSGISILNTLPGGKRLEHVRIENVEARRFGKYGIAVGGWPEDKSQSGFRDVLITGCRASDNALVGIHVYGFHDYYAKTYAHRDVAVIDCVSHDNPGDPDKLDNHSGDGILLHDVDGGRIDGCTAFGNGSLCRAESGGPVGIWAWSSRKLVIQNCVSVRNRTGGKYDGGGFDFDGGVSESVMQYNYSAENDGAGYLVFDFGAAPFRLADNVVRFNISENDGRKNGYAGITVNSVGEPVERLQLLHNTAFVGKSDVKERPAALCIHQSKDCRVHNNLLIATDGCALADVGADQAGLHVQGNHYWAADNAFLIRHAGRNLHSLADWRKQSGQERLDSQDVGAAGDPLVGAIGRGDVIEHASKRATLERYKPQKDSPLIGSGLNLKSLFK